MAQEDVTAFIRGGEFPMDTKGIQKDSMDMRLAGNVNALLIFKYEYPTKNEVFDFEHGQAGIALHKEGKLMMVVADIEGVGTADCVYHLDRFTHGRINWVRTEKGKGMAVHLMLVDEKNILRVMRTIGVSSEFTNYFADLIEHQQTEEGRLHNGESEFVELGARAYKKYPSVGSIPIDVAYTTAKQK